MIYELVQLSDIRCDSHVGILVFRCPFLVWKQEEKGLGGNWGVGEHGFQNISQASD